MEHVAKRVDAATKSIQGGYLDHVGQIYVPEYPKSLDTERARNNFWIDALTREYHQTKHALYTREHTIRIRERLRDYIFPAIIPGTKDFVSTICSLTEKSMNTYLLWETLVRDGIPLFHSYEYARAITNRMILSGKMDAQNARLFTFFKMRKKPYCLFTHRPEDVRNGLTIRWIDLSEYGNSYRTLFFKPGDLLSFQRSAII